MGSRGFSLIELMIAIVVLAVGLLAGMLLMCVSAASNGRSKLNTTASTLAESTLERIIAIPQSAGGAAALTSVTDCSGNVFNMSTAPGGAPLVDAGAFGIVVDYNQPAVPNYSMQYMVCAAGQGLTYDVRWNVAAGPTPSTQLVTVSAKANTVGGPNGLARAITLRSLRGNF